MPEENKTEWELKQLQKTTKKHEDEIEKIQESIFDFKAFKEITLEKLIQLSQAIEKFEEKDRWEKRTFTASLIGAVLSGVVSLIIWAFQN